MSVNPTESLDKTAFAEAIFDQYGGFLLRVIRFHVKNEAVAHDLLQDFFVRLLERPIPENITNIKRYLYRVLTHDLIDSQRRLMTYQRKLSEYGCYQQRVKDSSQTARRSHLNHEMDRMFEAIERQLPQREAKAVTLRYRENCDVAEVAQRMGVNPRSVSRYISMGLSKLRKVLAP